MLTGQMLVFILLLETVVVVESYLSETAESLDSLSEVRYAEFVSENVMLDCCLRLHEWVRDNPEATDAQLTRMAAQWEDVIREHLEGAGLACNLTICCIALEPLINQTLDPLQAGFLGSDGYDRTFVSAMLNVSLAGGDLLYEKAYQIRIAA